MARSTARISSPSQLHSNADALSRVPSGQCGKSVSECTSEPTFTVETATILAKQELKIKQLQHEYPLLKPIIECKQKNLYPGAQHTDIHGRRLLRTTLGPIDFKGRYAIL